jgi:hypothetical protein
MVPFLMLFTAALKLGQRPIVAIAACVGLFTTISSLILSAIPAADDPNKPLAVAKVLLLTLITLGAGVIFYMLGRRRALTVGSRGAQLGL